MSEATIGPFGDTGPALLLSDPSPVLRYRVLTELLDVEPDDAEVRDLARHRVAAAEPLTTQTRSAQVTSAQAKSAQSKSAQSKSAQSKSAPSDDPKALAWALCRWAHCGFGRDRPEVEALAERLLSLQTSDGSFPLRLFRRGQRDGVYSMAPLQAALPLRGLAAAGYATDPRTERAYDWLLAQQLDDGAWPMGTAHGQPAYIAGYRKLPGSKGCRATTQGALACLVLHPDRARAPRTRHALDLLLQRETRDEWALGSEVARLTGWEPARGFVTFYARFDLAFVLDIAARAGASADDERIAGLVEFLLDRRGPFGLWEHPTYPELSRWLTFDILRSLRLLRSDDADWQGIAPRVSFQAYPARPRRF